MGSIGLDSVEEVFATVGRLLGPYLKRVPDGEPGGRRMWISWQAPVLRANPFLQVDSTSPQLSDFAPLKIADGVDPADVRFGELGYAREARAHCDVQSGAETAGAAGSRCSNDHLR